MFILPDVDGVKMEAPEEENGLLTVLCEKYHVCLEEVESLQCVYVESRNMFMCLRSPEPWLKSPHPSIMLEFVFLSLCIGRRL